MLMNQPDLFSLSPCGLSFWNEGITAAQEASLIEHIDAEPLEPFRFQGWTGKRETHSFGWHYDFERGGFEKTDPVPHWLQPIRNSLAKLSGIAPEDLVQVLLTRYEAGAGIGWHRDRSVFNDVVGLSLGSEAPLRFRRRAGSSFERYTVSLASRSVYLLSGEARNIWEHSIPPVKEPRWSITFRTLSSNQSARRKVAYSPNHA